MKRYKIKQGFLETETIGEVTLKQEVADFDLVLQPVKSHKGDYFQVVALTEQARELAKRGGEARKKQKPDYSAMGKKGMAKRWKKKP